MLFIHKKINVYFRQIRHEFMSYDQTYKQINDSYNMKTQLVKLFVIKT